MQRFLDHCLSFCPFSVWQLIPGEGHKVANPQSWSGRPRVTIRGRHLYWRLSGYNTENSFLIIVGNLFGDCHAPCTIKTSFVDFEKKMRIVAVTKEYIVRPPAILHTFSAAVNDR